MMRIDQLVLNLHAIELNVEEAERDVTSGYAGDFLSFVMGRAPSGCAWFTVMTNVNVLAVAALADVAVVVICESCPVDDAFLLCAKQKGINVISTSLDVYGAILKAAI